MRTEIDRMTKRVRKQCVLATIGLFAFACVGFISGDIPLNEIVSQSSMIVYARADTNNAPNIHLVITEIWKDKHDVLSPGIIVGTQVPLQWPTNGGFLPDGAVLFYEQSLLLQMDCTSIQSIWFEPDRLVA